MPNIGRFGPMDVVFCNYEQTCGNVDHWCLLRLTGGQNTELV